MEEQKKITKRITIRGKVQNVGFRYFVLDAIKRDEIYGYVKNLSDGSLEVVVQGSINSIDILESLCQKGPTDASVTEVIIEELPTDVYYKTFTIQT